MLWEKNIKSDDLFSSTNKLSLENIYKMQVALIVFRYFYSTASLPKCIIELFEKTSDIHGYQTRSLDNMCLFTHLGKLNVRKKSLKISAPIIWNNIPPVIKYINSEVMFKKEYKSLLLRNL